MKLLDLAKELKLEDKILSITATNNSEVTSSIKSGCTLKALNLAINNGETIFISEATISCSGAKTGFGLYDGLPKIPGGFGNFIAQGAGKGFPPGERIKATPQIGEKMLLGQPQDVLSNYDFLRIKPYCEDDQADLVTSLVNADQLSALVHLFNYRKTGYDTIIAPMTSGCASIFRIPLGELKLDNPRGVIGNLDIFSRPHFDKDTFFFTVPEKDFRKMLEDADESFLIAPIWNGVRKRLHNLDIPINK